MQKHVLVVGDDPILARELRSRNGSDDSAWGFRSVRNPLETLAALQQAQYTAVVASERLSGGISGSALLDEVLRRQPRCLSFLLTELPDKRSAIRNIGTAHRLLVSPADLEALKQAVEKAEALEVWLPGEKVRSLLMRLHHFPSPPNLYFQVANKLQSATTSLDEIGEIISRDPAMTAKVLQLVNSAVFGLQRQIDHPAEAIGFLGLEMTRSLILLAHTFSHFDAFEPGGFSVESLWQHSLTTARYAQRIAELEAGGPDLPAQAFTAGLLHDVGQLMLAANVPDDLQKANRWALAERIELWGAEEAVLGTNHAEVGACLLAIWGLPSPIIEAVGLHHRPVRLSSAGFTPLVAVHAANVWARASNPNPALPPAPQMDTAYLQGCGCADRVAEWQEALADHDEETRIAVGF